MGGGKMGGRGRFWRSGPVSEAPPMGIRTPQPLPEGPAEGGALGEGPLGPYADRRGRRERTGPDRQNALAPPYAAPPICRPPNISCPGRVL